MKNFFSKTAAVTLLFVVLLASPCCLFAQSEKHVESRGIPMTGNIKEFSQKMEQPGYQQAKIEKYGGNIGYVFAGKYADPNAIIMVAGHGEKETVFSVAIVLPDDKDKVATMNRYTTMRNLLEEKYNPTHRVHDNIDELLKKY